MIGAVHVQLTLRLAAEGGGHGPCGIARPLLMTRTARAAMLTSGLPAGNGRE